MGKGDDGDRAITTTMWKFAVGLIGLIFAGLLFVNEQFLTIREHTEFKSRVDGSILDIRNAVSSHTASDNVVFVSRNEFDRWLKQHDVQLSNTSAAINRIEATRPTTGELQATATSLTERISRLEAEVRDLRQWQKKLNDPKKP